MEVLCPSCSSRFNLPDTAVRPGAKLRCSVCKTVFPLQDTPLGDGMGDARKRPPSAEPLRMARPSRAKKVLRFLFLLVLLGGAAGGGWWYLKGEGSSLPDVVSKVGGGAWRFLKTEGGAIPEMVSGLGRKAWSFVKGKTGGIPASPSGGVSPAQKVERLTMRNVRQYYVTNEKIGPISVIEGKAVNGFPTPRELIEVEAALYGQDKNPLVSKKQFAGATLSLFQLQVLGDKELDAFINNKLEVLANNTNIPPGGEVPFMVLFYNPPPTVAEFGVKIVDVREPEVKK